MEGRGRIAGARHRRGLGMRRPKGIRTRDIGIHLGGAYIDFIRFDDDPGRYVANALNVTVRAVEVSDRPTRTAIAVVDTHAPQWPWGEESTST